MAWNARLDGGRREREPAGDQAHQVRLEHRAVLEVGVQGRPLPRDVLQLLDQRAHLVAGHRKTR